MNRTRLNLAWVHSRITHLATIGEEWVQEPSILKIDKFAVCRRFFRSERRKLAEKREHMLGATLSAKFLLCR